jgi:hypothetical protein
MFQNVSQVGLAEMRPAVESTGGLMVMAETTSSPNFRTSLQKLLESDDNGHLKMAFSAVMEVYSSREIKVGDDVRSSYLIARFDLVSHLIRWLQSDPPI